MQSKYTGTVAGPLTMQETQSGFPSWKEIDPDLECYIGVQQFRP